MHMHLLEPNGQLLCLFAPTRMRTQKKWTRAYTCTESMNAGAAKKKKERKLKLHVLTNAQYPH